MKMKYLLRIRPMYFASILLGGSLIIGCSERIPRGVGEPRSSLERHSVFLDGHHALLPSELSLKKGEALLDVLLDDDEPSWRKLRAWAALSAVKSDEAECERRDRFRAKQESLFLHACDGLNPLQRACRRSRLEIRAKGSSKSRKHMRLYCSLLENELRATFNTAKKDPTQSAKTSALTMQADLTTGNRRSEEKIRRHAFGHALKSEVFCSQHLLEQALLSAPLPEWPAMVTRHQRRH
ncbi:MAG: hypothetical protein GY822_07780 [Deltaproteobacteria bacterium]|nr:hypothetical protein [Deltaproteobacteria bacterium]